MNLNKNKPSVRIITNPAIVRQICCNQPKVTLEQARQSVQAGVRMGRADCNGVIK
jgi:hypothetical protein